MVRIFGTPRRAGTLTVRSKWTRYPPCSTADNFLAIEGGVRMATQREMNLFDNRIVHRNLRRGLISQAEYDKYLKELPDVTEKAEPISEPQPLEPHVETH